MRKVVLVRWKTRGSILGRDRHPGEEDLMSAGSARFLAATGVVEVVGSPEKTVLTLAKDDDDEHDNAG